MTLLKELIHKRGLRPKLAIAIVSPYDFSYDGGVNDSIVTAGRELERRGHKVTIVAPSRTRPDGEGFINSGRAIVKLPNSGSVGRFNIRSPYWGRLVRRLRRQAFDVFCLHEVSVPSFPQHMASKVGGNETANLAIFHAAGEAPWHSYYSRWLDIVGTKRAIARNLHQRLAVSRAAQALFEPLLPGNYTILPNPVDTERFTPNNRQDLFPDGRVNVLFVGRHGEREQRKGFVYLCEAFTLLNGWGYCGRVRLVIGGAGKIDRESRSMLGRIPTNSYVVLGRIPPEGLATQFASADILCAPSTGHESFGLVPAQGMASGVATIASNIEGYTNVVTGHPEWTHEQCQGALRPMSGGLRKGEGCVLVAPRSAHEIATAIKLLVDDEALRRTLGYQGRRLIESNYSPGRVVDNLEREMYRAAAALPDASNLARKTAHKLDRPSGT